MNDIHDIIARAERVPGNAVSIDPPDAGDGPECQCGDIWGDHVVVIFRGETHRICRDAIDNVMDVLTDHDNIFREREPEDDEPDWDRIRDERYGY